MRKDEWEAQCVEVRQDYLQLQQTLAESKLPDLFITHYRALARGILSILDATFERLDNPDDYYQLGFHLTPEKVLNDLRIHNRLILEELLEERKAGDAASQHGNPMKETHQVGHLFIQKEYAAQMHEHVEMEEQLYRVREITVNVQQGEKSIQFHELYPMGWRIVEVQAVTPGDNINAWIEWRDQIIAIPRTVAIQESNPKTEQPFLTTDNAFLVLLHEIGHTHMPLLPPKNDEEAAEIDTLEATLKTYQVLQLDGLPQECRELYISRIYQPERMASAYALRTLRGLRSKGIDLAPNLSNQDIVKQMNAFLASYKDRLT